jgi:hypothetical protein
LRKNGDPDNYATTAEWAWLPAAEGEEHYDPKLTVHQGNGLKGPLFAISRRALDASGERASIIARTYAWYVKYPDDPWYIPAWDAPEDPSIYVWGAFEKDENVLSAAPELLSGTGLGLTILQLCVSDYYGDCGPTVPTQHPKVYFYGTWPRSPTLGLYGRKFEH